MPSLAFIPTLLRETLGSREIDDRIPEPDLVMDGEDEVAAYTLVGRVDGPMEAVYLFHAAHISSVIEGCETVVDLACGPATQMCEVAKFHPEISFRGVDLSPGMLKSARRHVNDLGLTNVDFSEGDITNLEMFEDHSVDGIISTVALHHLPTIDHLRATFREINRVLHPGGALYLVDFGRLKFDKSIRFFAYKDEDTQPEVFCRDYENSLRAAFLLNDFKRLTAEELPHHVRVHRTFLTPFFTLIKSGDRTTPEARKQRIKQQRAELLPRYRNDLDDLRTFFRLGGLRGDPFR